jgi:hypothetical protein
MLPNPTDYPFRVVKFNQADSRKAYVFQAVSHTFPRSDRLAGNRIPVGAAAKAG